MVTVKKVTRFFDKLEDSVRISLSHYPVVYAVIGGVGVVLFWKGVWETAEYFPILSGPSSVLLGIIILLFTGLLVSFFIGDSIILSGLNREKKLVEKTESEVRAEKNSIQYIVAKLEIIEQNIERLHHTKNK